MKKYPSKEELAETQERARREQAKEQVRRFEEGEPGASLKVECHMAKAYLDRGQEYVDETTDEFVDQMANYAIKKGPKGLTLEKAFANEGYDCTLPTPAQLDKKYEKPADNSSSVRYSVVRNPTPRPNSGRSIARG